MRDYEKFIQVAGNNNAQNLLDDFECPTQDCKYDTFLEYIFLV